MPAPRALAAGAVASAIVGLGASLTALVDDLGGAPTFCAETGCELVRASAWAAPLGIPMSVLGVAFFAAALALAFARGPRLARVRRYVAVAGGAWAVWLIGLQAFEIGAWCKLCLVADPAAIAYAVLVLAGAGAVTATPRRVAALVPAVGTAVGALALWTRAPAPAAEPVSAATPASVAREQVAGAVTVVEYIDFECPFCREMQARLERAIAQAGVPVRVVRKMVPLPGHPGALPAALAWCCADAQGRGEEMARALFEAPVEALTPEGCEAIAARVGCDMERFRADLAAARERVARDVADARAAGVRGLPTLFVGGERVTGASASVDELAAMLAHGARS